MKRYLYRLIREDLDVKMVFVGGPRQVGKTTLSFSFLSPSSAQSDHYFTWDSRSDRNKLLEEHLPMTPGVVVLDEVHKYAQWRNLIKGLYDKNSVSFKFLITGSARLDYYRRGGDSLQGRYHYYRLHPITLGEVQGTEYEDVDRLMDFGGFPEPFFAANRRQWRRWQNERVKRVFQEDVISLEKVRELSSLSMLADMLPGKVGSPLSLNNLATDLEVAHATVKNWLQILSNLYVCYMIPPFGAPEVRAVKKEQKLYLWDWSLCESEGARFENMVGSHLLKYCHFMEDSEGYTMELRYLRDTDGREVDFVVLQDGKPQFAVECKLRAKEISKHIHYFKQRTQIPTFYQVHKECNKSYQKDGVICLSLLELVRLLKLP